MAPISVNTIAPYATSGHKTLLSFELPKTDLPPANFFSTTQKPQ